MNDKPKPKVTSAKKTWPTLIKGIGIGVFLTSLVFFTIRKQPLDTLSVKFSDGEVSMDIKTSKIEYDSILSKLFSTPFSEAGTKGWLAKNKLIFSINDMQLASEMRKLNHNHELCEAIREMSKDREGPFSIVADSAFVSVPGIHTLIPEDVVYTWYRGRFDKTQIRLMDPESGMILTLPCYGNMGAKPDGYSGRIDFNISKLTALKLFGLKSAKDIKKEMKVFVTFISNLK